MKINVLKNNDKIIVVCTFLNKYELTSTFVRLEEFYESPFPEIRNNYFTLDDYMDIYAKNNNGRFSYFEDWAGFNIPGYIYSRFLETFKDDLRKKESQLFNQIDPHIYHLSEDKFYIIAMEESRLDVLDHELAHAFYYLEPDYKLRQMYEETQLTRNAKILLYEKLEKYGYDSSVWVDEVQAMISEWTESYKQLEKKHGIKFDRADRKYVKNVYTAMRKNFLEYKSKYYK